MSKKEATPSSDVSSHECAHTSSSTPPITPTGRLLIPIAAEWLLSFMKRSARFLRNNGITLPGGLYLLAAAFERVGFRGAAAKFYAFALRYADTSSSRFIFAGRQSWEFQSERNLARLGRGRVVDPLFDCTALPDVTGGMPSRVRGLAPGYYQAFLTHKGLAVDGFLRTSLGQAELEVLIENQVIRRLTAAKEIFGIPVFALDISRAALALMPSECALSLRLSSGEVLLNGGSRQTRLHVPHGQHINALSSAEAIHLDKKGFLIGSTPDTAELQRGFLEIYDQARNFFDVGIGKQLFILYGTLLGQHRQQGFIPGDDDFDVGYYTDASCSKDVLAEGMDIVIALVEAGFVVSVNRGGRLFRLRLPGLPPACHLDVHAVWRERRSLWIHPMANLDCDRDAFLPVQVGKLAGMNVYTPCRPEDFLEGYYGADWRIPNPAYSTAARHFPRWKRQLLKRSCITPKQLTQMQGRIAASHHNKRGDGALVAIGLQSIYPLDRYESLCGW